MKQTQNRFIDIARSEIFDENFFLKEDRQRDHMHKDY